ncbi:restriction endonuclease [Methylobacterium organophilum]|uniref:restriction endonuclease n=1 Tax=Methylobacterium organophilum TaxID=410 RepID=UPI001F13A660|nr:restriction endonuclease [Methylobacterium organophilum]UMY17483.1 restriction endonuclease [Methylobacterium organophilum]
MSNGSVTARRLFWTLVIGGGAAFWYGRPALLATAAAMVAIALHRLDRPRRFRACIRRIARQHAATLALRRRQERYVDAYGNLIEDGWLRERDYFAERTLVPALEERGYAALIDRNWDRLLDTIERVAAGHPLPEEEDLPEDGIDYERFCIARLVRAGWSAHPTPASGDQGADIVAERDGLRLVVQCKRYGRAVGNAAVQEVAAAARYWSADAAAVVSNAGFTPAARRLAAATGVKLLHHDDLGDLAPEGGALRGGQRA